MSLAYLPKDAPFPASQLDNVRVTVVYATNGQCQQFTDDGSCTLPPLSSSWTGVTIFQIKGDVRKELAMHVKEPLVGARQMGKMTKQRHAKPFKKDKSNLTERTMTPDERAQFKAAKVKELKSFFENQVWTFESLREAEPARTLTSRMFGRRTRMEPQGQKQDSPSGGSWIQNAWDGTTPTSSPTTTRLSRSCLLSLAATMSWPVWTSDIATGFFDAAFATRADGSSQIGYIILLINKSLLRPDGTEGAYHILDWKSQKTPRVARSSLGAEAQGGGQACDALEHVCVYWNCLLDPRRKLKELLDCKSTLEPTMVTDAKALYDSFHREGYGTSVVDKRVSLEVRVMKERLLALGGSLRWMSSERQLADGLTKESPVVCLLDACAMESSNSSGILPTRPPRRRPRMS